MKTHLLVFLILISASVVCAQRKTKGYAALDTVCIKLKSAIQMESGKESEIITARNSCDETLDIQIYKQNKEGHWFSSRYEAIEPGGYVRTSISLTGKYVIYKRVTDSKEAFPSIEEIKRNYDRTGGGSPK